MEPFETEYLDHSSREFADLNKGLFKGFYELFEQEEYTISYTNLIDVK